MCVWTNVPAAVDPQEGDLVILRGDLHDNSLCTALGAAALAYCADALGEHVGAHVAWQQMIEGREKEVERERERRGGERKRMLRRRRWVGLSRCRDTETQR